MTDVRPAIAYPAATVVLLRDGDNGCEVLMVRRNAQLAFHGGAWVFPGGRLDPEDYAGGDDVIEAARRAAVREAAEEAGVEVALDELVLFSRWITPEPVPKRFDTWFFAAPARGSTVTIDGAEIHAFSWMRPADAIAGHRQGEIDLPPPTFVTLTELSQLGCVADTLATLRARSLETFIPRLNVTAGGPCTLYHGDAGYDDGDTERPGPRHRLLMHDDGWRYERSR